MKLPSMHEKKKRKKKKERDRGVSFPEYCSDGDGELVAAAFQLGFRLRWSGKGRCDNHRESDGSLGVDLS